MDQNFFITNNENYSENEFICDKESEQKMTKEMIILKQIEDDLATHGFSKPHVTREQIQTMLKMKVKILETTPNMPPAISCAKFVI